MQNLCAQVRKRALRSDEFIYNLMIVRENGEAWGGREGLNESSLYDFSHIRVLTKEESNKSLSNSYGGNYRHNMLVCIQLQQESFIWVDYGSTRSNKFECKI